MLNIWILINYIADTIADKTFCIYIYPLFILLITGILRYCLQASLFVFANVSDIFFDACLVTLHLRTNNLEIPKTQNHSSRQSPRHAKIIVWGWMPLGRWGFLPQHWVSASFTKILQARHRALSVPCAPDMDSVGLVTWSQSAAALPALRARRLPAGLPQGQVVLVVSSHPCRAHHGSHIQAERQEDAHQSDQLQRCQRGAARWLFRLGDSGHHGVDREKEEVWKADQCPPCWREPDSEARAEFLLLLPLQPTALRRFACEQHLCRAPEVSVVYSVDVKAPRDQRVPQGPKERKQSKTARPGPLLKSGTSVPNKTGLKFFQTFIVEMIDTAIHTGSTLYRFSIKQLFHSLHQHESCHAAITFTPKKTNWKSIGEMLRAR